MGTLFTVVIGTLIFSYAIYTIYKSVKKAIKNEPGCGCGGSGGDSDTDADGTCKTNPTGCSGCSFNQNGSACNNVGSNPKKPR